MRDGKKRRRHGRRPHARSIRIRRASQSPAAPSPAQPPAPQTPSSAPTAATTAVPPGSAKAGGASVLIGLGLVAAAAGLIFWVEKRRQLKQGEATYMPLVREAAMRVGIPAWVLAGIVNAESGWNNSPNAEAERCGIPCRAGTGSYGTSGGCAVGLTMMKLAAAQGVGAPDLESICEPANALFYGAKHLKRLYAVYGTDTPIMSSTPADWERVFSAYNRGGGSLQKEEAAGGSWQSLNPDYVNHVLAAAEGYQEAGIAGGALAAVPRPARPRSLPAFRLFRPLRAA